MGLCHLYHLNIVDTVQESFMNLQEMLKLRGWIGRIGYMNVNAVNWIFDKNCESICESPNLWSRRRFGANCTYNLPVDESAIA